MNDYSFNDLYYMKNTVNHEKNDKHEQILRAAIKTFARKGFYNTRISDIAKEANVADGTIYLYFKNKDNLLVSLFEESMNQIIQMVEEKLANVDDPIEKLRTFIRFHFELIQKDKFLSEVISVELRQSNKFIKEYKNIKFKEYLNIISAIIREGQSRGLIAKHLVPGILKRIIFGALDELTLLWVLSGDSKYPLDKLSSDATEVLINGIAIKK
jgi:TetR/AcrR family fatty acid metabolism transcriptional regulator